MSAVGQQTFEKAWTKMFRAALHKGGFTRGRANRYSIRKGEHGFEALSAHAFGAKPTVVAAAGSLGELERTVLALHFSKVTGAHVVEQPGLPVAGPAEGEKTCNRDGKPCSFPRCMPCDEVRGGLFPVTRARQQQPTAKRSIARLFVLNRRVDATGTSGTGIVAEGVRFSNGKVALHWLSHLGAVNVYDSMDVCEVLHGHDGNTVVEWKDEVR